MDEETVTTATSDAAPMPGDAVAVPPTPEAPPAPSLEDQVRQLREDNARLQGRLEARPAPAAEPAKPAPPLTADAIEKAFAAGDVDDAGRIRLHAQNEARRMRAEDDERRSLDDAHAQIGHYIQAHPDLGHPGTPLLNEVAAELQIWQRTNPSLDPNDPRTQVLATKAVLERKGVKAPGPGPREYNRQRIPVGGGGGGGAETPTPAGEKKNKGEAIWAKLTPQAKIFYQSYESPGNPGAASMERIFKTLEHADEDLLRKHGRLVG